LQSVLSARLLILVTGGVRPGGELRHRYRADSQFDR
jgi:hypothetical protein